MDRELSLTEIAEILGKHRWTIWRWLKDGRLKSRSWDYIMKVKEEGVPEAGKRPTPKDDPDRWLGVPEHIDPDRYKVHPILIARLFNIQVQTVYLLRRKGRMKDFSLKEVAKEVLRRCRCADCLFAKYGVYAAKQGLIEIDGVQKRDAEGERISHNRVLKRERNQWVEDGFIYKGPLGK